MTPELEFWRGAAFIFLSSRGTAINTNNFLFRVTLRRTCSPYMGQITTVKDVQAHLRHTNIKTTLEHHTKSASESVRIAVESLDQSLKKKPSSSESPAN